MQRIGASKFKKNYMHAYDHVIKTQRRMYAYSNKSTEKIYEWIESWLNWREEMGSFFFTRNEIEENFNSTGNEKIGRKDLWCDNTYIEVLKNQSSHIDSGLSQDRLR